MGLLQCPLCCHSEQHHQEPRSQSHHLHSESSNSSSLSSQPSLPSVPSLTPQPSNQPQTAHHRLITTLKAHSTAVSSLTLAGKLLYSGSSNSEIHTWIRDPLALQSSNSANDVVATCNGSATKALIVLNDKLFSAHQDHKIRVWKIEANDRKQRYKCIATLPTLNDRFSRLFLAKNYVEVRRSRKCLWVDHVDTVSALALSTDGSLLYSASWDRTFKIWRTSDFRCLESVGNAHDDAINALILSNDGFVYTGSADRKIKVWKKMAGEKKHSLLATLEKHKSAVNALALSEDGSILYSGACDRSILVWEKDRTDKNGGNMAVAGALRGHTKAILCLVTAADLVFSGSADNTIRIWRKGTEKSYSCMVVLEGHRKPVKCLAVAVDFNNSKNGGSERSCSYFVCSGSLDCDIRIWQVGIPLF